MKNIIFWSCLVLIYFCCISCGNQHVINTFDKADELIPKGVKTKIEIRYNFIVNTSENKKSLEHKYIYQYDHNGRNIKFLWYDNRNELKYTTLYNYDKSGKMIDSNTYDSNNKLIFRSIPRYNHDNREIYQYDANGNLFTKQISKCNSRGLVSEVLNYDAKNKLTSKFLYRYDNNSLCQTDVYNYNLDIHLKLISKDDNKNRLIELDTYNTNNELEEKTFYKYGSGDILREKLSYTIKKANGKTQEIPKSQIIYEYEFFPNAKK